MARVDSIQAMICLAFLLLAALHAQGGVSKEKNHRMLGEESLVPVPSIVFRSVPQEKMPSEPFQTCGECRCCSPSDSSSCVQTQCCFDIKCNLPDKPFGTCSFSPLTCGCGANNCTNSSSPPRSSAHLKAL